MRLALALFLAFSSLHAYGFTSAENWVTRYTRSGGDIKRVTGYVPGPRSSASFVEEPLQAVPDEWDWREHGLVRQARNQGQCGSCYSFATTGIIEIVSQLQQKASLNPLLLSNQAVISCSKYDCDGGDFDVLDFMKDKGLPLEAAYPYTASNSSCHAYKANTKISSWSFVGNGKTPPKTQAIKQAIYDHGPVSVDVAVDDTWESYSDGIYDGCSVGASALNHMVILLGWGQDNGKDYWIVLNSWGSEWGEGGTMRTIPIGKDGKDCNAIGDSAAFVTVNGVDNLRTFLNL